MARNILKGISNIRFPLDTEIDADSPITALLMAGLVQGINEGSLLWGTGIIASGTATSDPPNDTTGVFADSSKTWIADQHNGRTLIICSGNACGNFYTIDDTDDDPDSVICTGDNLYSDGVRSGDEYIITYDIKVNADGHDHDGVNSKGVSFPAGQMFFVLMNEQQTEISATPSATVFTIPFWVPNGGNTTFGYRPRIHVSGGTTAYCYAVIGGAPTGSCQTNSGTYVWAAEGTVDCSGESPGATTLTISINATTGGTSYLQGLVCYWK